MKKSICYLVILLAIASMLIAGCNQPAAPTTQPPSATQPTSSQPPTTMETPKPSVTSSTITLRLGHDSAPDSFFGVASLWWAGEVAKRTEGRVKVDVYPASSLVAQVKALDYLRSGMADLYVVSIGTHAMAFPLSVADSLPGIGFPLTAEGKAIANNTFNSIHSKYPSLANEWKEFKIITYYSGDNRLLIMKDKPVRVPADLNGVKMGSLGTTQEFVKVCGAVPVMDIPPQSYEKLQTGITQGTVIDWSAVLSFQLFEVSKCITTVLLGGNGLPLVMSKNIWDKISASDQKILLDVGTESQKACVDSLIQRVQLGKEKFLSTPGRTIITPNADELKLWQEKYDILQDKWVAQSEAAGLKDARGIVDEWKAASKKAGGG